MDLYEMYKPSLTLTFLLAVLLSCPPLYSQKLPDRPKGNETFFGLHFDFHADNTSPIGKSFDPALVDSMLTVVKPEFIQVDCKGHPGISSYPTRIGFAADTFHMDILEEWRKITAKHGISLYTHFSGVIDDKVVRELPAWAAKKPDGTAHRRATSVFSPYAQEKLIPQLQELVDQYAIDGAWIDGECWGLQPDYSEYSKTAYEKAGLGKELPLPGNEAYPAFLEFNRTGFKTYLQHYVQAMHDYKPGFEITSNWAFSSSMPEKVTVDVDFLSGDLSSNNAFYSAALESRVLAFQGLHWDCMSWGFVRSPRVRPSVGSLKSPVQLKQEAAQVIANGGAYQVYFKQNKDGSIRPANIPLMKEIADFVRERRPFCEGTKPLAEVALLLSTEGFKRKTTNVYRRWNGEYDEMHGILSAFLDAQVPVNVLMEHSLEEYIEEYKLVVIPEWKYFDPSFKDLLQEYVEGGGNLLLIGTGPAEMFKNEIGFREVENDFGPLAKLKYDHGLAGVNPDYASFKTVALPAGAKTLGTLWDFDRPSFPVASITPYGQGRIAAIYADLGRLYKYQRSSLYRDFLIGIKNELIAAPFIEVTGSGLVHVVVGEKNSSTLVHLINSSGPHRDENIFVYDEIPVIGSLTLKMRSSKPKAVTLQPEGRSLDFEYEDGQVMISLDKVAIHSIIELAF